MSAAEQIILSDNDSGSELSSLEEPTHVANDKKRKTEHAAIEKKKLKEDVEVIHIPSVAKEVIDIDNAEYFANLNLKKLCEVGSLESVKQRVEKGEIPDQACVFRAAKYANLDVLSYLLGDLKTKFDVSVFSFITDAKVLLILLVYFIYFSVFFLLFFVLIVFNKQNKCNSLFLFL